MSEQHEILKFFSFQHLPSHLTSISEPFSVMAHRIVEDLPKNAETDMALRKLLEAKDCAVRSVIK